VSHNAIQSTEGLSKLKKLRKLDLAGNMIDDLSPVGELPQLTYLNVSHNLLTSLMPLKNPKKLKVLAADANPLHLPLNLNSLENLEELSLSGVGLRNADSLETLKKLQTLRLRDNELDNLDGLKNLKKLTLLDLSNNAAQDLSALKDLTKLLQLFLMNNKIADLAPLNKLSNLTHLNLAWNSISNSGGFAKLCELEMLDLSYNDLRDLKELFDLPYLQVINLTGNESLSPKLVKSLLAKTGDSPPKSSANRGLQASKKLVLPQTPSPPVMAKPTPDFSELEKNLDVQFERLIQLYQESKRIRHSDAESSQEDPSAIFFEELEDQIDKFLQACDQAVKAERYALPLPQAANLPMERPNEIDLSEVPDLPNELMDILQALSGDGSVKISKFMNDNEQIPGLPKGAILVRCQVELPNEVDDDFLAEMFKNIYGDDNVKISTGVDDKLRRLLKSGPKGVKTIKVKTEATKEEFESQLSKIEQMFMLLGYKPNKNSMH
jgi:hypothetical protein